MLAPSNVSLPFFSYGIFQPGELSHFRIRRFVTGTSTAWVKGGLRLRDGLLIADPGGSDRIAGVVLTFDPATASDAYDAIAELEPKSQYRWEEVQTTSGRANILWGVSPKKGSNALDSEWSSWDDPLFTDAIDLVFETVEANTAWEWDTKQAFRVQMAYLLLWNSIERYVSLRYHLGGDATQKVLKLAEEPAFAEGLRRLSTEERSVQRADQPQTRLKFDRNDPKAAVNYYYQVRSNMVHRGKSMPRDHRIVVESCSELVALFKHVLAQAKSEATT